MRRVLLTLLLSAGVMAAQTAILNGVPNQQLVFTGTLPAFAQAPLGNASSGNVASLAKAFGSNNIKGDSIVVSVGVGNTTTPTISDTNSNTYKQIYSLCNGNVCAYQFLAVNIIAGANTVTVNNGGSTTSIAMGIYEFSGFLTATITAGGTASAASLVYDVLNGNTGTGTSISLTNSANTSTPNEFGILTVGVGTAAQTITPAAPLTNDSGQQNPATPNTLYSFNSSSTYIPTTTTGTIAATLGGSEPWVAVFVTYRTPIVPVEGKVSIDQTGTNNGVFVANTPSVKVTDGTNTVAVDPCEAQTRSTYVVNITSSTQVITGSSGKQTYVCFVQLSLNATADNIAMVEGTGTTCGSSTAGMAGGATAATGWNLTASGSVTSGVMHAWAFKTATLADNVCLLVSSAAQVSGIIQYVQQ